MSDPPTPTRSPPSAPEHCSDLAAPLAPGFAFGSLLASNAFFTRRDDAQKSGFRGAGRKSLKRVHS